MSTPLSIPNANGDIIQFATNQGDGTSGNPYVLAVQPTPVAAGGLSVYRTLDCQPTGVNIKATPGQIGGWYLSNGASSVRYVKLYDKATAPSQSDTPKVTISLPANSAANVCVMLGIAFTAGIGIRGTTGIADNDTGAPTTNDIVVNLFYV